MGKPKKEAKKGSWDRTVKAMLRDCRKMQKENNPLFQEAMRIYEEMKAVQEELKKLKEAERKGKEEALRKYEEKKRGNFRELSQEREFSLELWDEPVTMSGLEIALAGVQKSLANNAVNRVLNKTM